MKIALTLDKSNSMHIFRGMVVPDNRKDEYVPIFQYMGTDKGKVIASGISSLKKYMKGV